MQIRPTLFYTLLRLASRRMNLPSPQKLYSIKKERCRKGTGLPCKKDNKYSVPFKKQIFPYLHPKHLKDP